MKSERSVRAGETMVRGMRKATIIAVILACSCVAAVWAGDTAAMWTRVYRRAESLEDRYLIMQTIVAQDDQQLAPLLVGTLKELNSEREQLSTTTERLMHTEFTSMIVREIGDLAAAAAKEQLFDLVKNARDARLRAEAALALGKVGAVEYADDIAILLRNLNLNYDRSADTGAADADAEILAYGCVLALERFKKPIGYTPLFFASIGWYSPASRVRQTAREVMPTVIDDPTDILKDLVKLEGEYSVKLQALQAERESSAPAERKVEVAVEALRQGLFREPTTVTEASALNQLRLDSMAMLITYGAKSEEAVGLLEELIYRNLDVNEKLTAIAALTAEGSDEAVMVLVDFLKLQNERQSSGVTPDDYRIIRATIQALGEMGSPLAVEELTVVRISNWTGSIVREANAALEKITE